MLYWLQTTFCSIQFLDFDLLVDLENASDYTKIFEIKEFCEDKDTQRKMRERIYTEDKNLYEPLSIFNILNESACFIDGSYDKARKNLECDFSNYLSSITSERDCMPHSSIDNTSGTTKCEKQNFTMEHSVYDTTNFKDYKNSQNDIVDYSHINTSCDNNTNLFSCTTQNDLPQGQCANLENNAFLKTSDCVFSVNHTYYINGPDRASIYTSSSVNSSLIDINTESRTMFNNAYKNANNAKKQEKKSNVNIISNIRVDNVKNALELKRKRSNNKLLLFYHFTANERELYNLYKSDEYLFRKFCKPIIKKKIPEFREKLKKTNLPSDFKHKVILALTSLSNFLDTICAIYIRTKQKSIQDFIALLDLAYDKFSFYDDILQKISIYYLHFDVLQVINNGFFRHDNCNFCKVLKLSNNVKRRLVFFYRRLIKLRDAFKKRKINN
ncbi:hypothetical protein AAJ76_2400050936 [Vairimorpha ceranae]|uniref:Uncharacterized protein n=1 Tax=Vairimorpha ceranae TaxID=40302 RepID=A0A0F9YS04_9MICR|nr:hypothetical protein AAJ76_2400050936 [Vairimorpha ceranae]KKO75342.1 hypothetical protein AAJ76_2400050936 [Vairimorpha ceranae]